MTMNLDDLRQILDLVREHELAEFELEMEGTRLRLRKHSAVVSAAPVYMGAAPAVSAVPAAVAASGTAAASSGGSPDAVEEGVELAIVTSPIVGTFYRAPSPEAGPFVEVGGRAKKGQPICIIEAMKLMNEIESDFEGEVVKVYVENGQPVQFGERLFAIRCD